MRKITRSICAFIVGGLTITVSLGINSAMVATFEAFHPTEEKCRKKRARQLWGYVFIMVTIAVFMFWIIARFTPVRDSNVLTQIL